jgi:hypothetical protein
MAIYLEAEADEVRGTENDKCLAQFGVVSCSIVREG